MIKIGRYFNGDIDGKFWFGVQASNDADNFGVKGRKPKEKDLGGLDYDFEEEHLPLVVEGIKKCRKELGSYKKQLDLFFKQNNGYNEQMVSKALKIPEDVVKELLVQYARLELGIMIRDCIKKTGQCYFWAEC